MKSNTSWQSNSSTNYQLEVQFIHRCHPQPDPRPTHGSHLFRPTSLFIIDNNGTKYTIDSFCGPIQFYYWDNFNPNPSSCTEYFGYGNRYNYDYLELAKNTAFITTLYIDSLMIYYHIQIHL